MSHHFAPRKSIIKVVFFNPQLPMTHQDGHIDDVSHQANLQHADHEAAKLAAHSVEAHPRAHEGHQIHKG